MSNGQVHLFLQQLGDCRCLLKFRQLGIHDDQQIDVAFRTGRSIGVRTKQNDFLGVEKNRNLVRQAMNGCLGDLSSIGNRRNADK